ncbi:MAG TPA: class I SAM-dependent methyltransferase [Candidatus Woesearchaeota archaeon]|nr:class I SAM-dependent methyltransferase [Candidatus Woesearchaeota archaeon]
MEKVTHARHWKKNASKKGVFVSNFSHHAFPILEKNNNIKKVLDVACGNGLGVSLPLLRKGFIVHAFDHTSAAINATKKNANKEGYKIFTKRSSMYNPFPYNNNAFDSTFCFQAIYHGRLENIMFTLSEIKRVTKKGGYFFGTFLTYNMIKNDKSRFYIEVRLPEGKIIKNYHKQDRSEPHLFYYLSKDFEYMQPHYYFTKEELKIILGQFFENVKVKLVKRDDYSIFWFAYGRLLP